jgi:hypothetical protein
MPFIATCVAPIEVASLPLDPAAAAAPVLGPKPVP